MAELTVPQINFAPLGQLGKVYQEAQDKQGLQDAFAGGIGSDPQSLAALAQRVGPYNPQLAVNLAQLAHGYNRETVTDARQQSLDKFNQSMETQRLAIAKQEAERRGQSESAKVAERDAVLKSKNIDPNSPEGRSYSIGGSYTDPQSTKPIAVETLGGTKFMVPKQGGGYTLVDPNNLPPEGLGAPSAPVPSSARVVGTAEGVASGLYPAPAPSAAPQGASPQIPLPAPRPVPAQATSFGDRFQGDPASGTAPPSLSAPPPPADPMAIDPQTGRREGFLQTVGGQQIQDYIKKIADYEIDPRTTSIKGGSRERLMSAVAHYDPTYNQNDFGARAKAIKDFATGPQGNIVRSFDVAIDHLDTLEGYVKALKNGDSRLINTIRNKWREQMGSELPTNVQAVGPVVGAEVTKAIVGSNNALADREELRKPLSGNGSEDQILGAVGAYKQLMGGQLKGLKKQYEETTGKKNFDTRIRENTRKVLMGGSEGGPKSPVVIDGYTIKEN